MQENLQVPTHKIGIIGGGQLAMMMSESAPDIGVEVYIQTPNALDPALVIPNSHGNEAILAAVNNASATAQLAKHSAIITFENEFVDITALAQLIPQGICFRPPLSSLALVLDKLEQRSQLQAMGLPVPNFASITPTQPPEALGFEYPVVIKARRHGYDGQGTHIIQDRQQLGAFWDAHASVPADTFMVEDFVPFEKELAVIAARSLTGDVAIFPLVETHQPNQVCRWAMAPVQVPISLVHQINQMGTMLLHQIDYIGVLALELFLTSSGDVLVNELAPRTHNSGHLTIEACETSQFAQHIRAVAGLSLGSPAFKCPGAIMINLLGYENGDAKYDPKLEKISQRPQTFVHWYYKRQSRVGRKLGHVTVLLTNPDRSAAIAAAQEIESLWYPNLSQT